MHVSVWCVLEIVHALLAYVGYYSNMMSTISIGTYMHAYKCLGQLLSTIAELPMASDLWFSLLCHGDDVSICSKIRPGPFWIILSGKPTAI